jgi:hypothetical protein
MAERSNRRLGILVLNAVLDTEAFMRTRDARISILARKQP